MMHRDTTRTSIASERLETRATCLRVGLVLLLAWFSAAAEVCAEDKITFGDHAKPIFQKRCASCHNSGKRSGGLDLTSFTNMMQGGSSGDSIEAGDADSSYLYSLVTHEDSPEMPPDGKIPDEEIAVIESWINGGALENKGSIAIKKKVNVAAAATAIGVRPETVAMPLRMSLQPHHRTEKSAMVRSIATSPWGPLVAVSSAKQVLLFNTASLQFLGALPYPDGQANVLQFSMNGSLLLAAGGRHGLVGKVTAFDVLQTRKVVAVGEELDNVLAADIHPDQTLVAMGGPQRMVRVYSTDDSSLLYEKKKHTDWVTAAKFSPDGVLLATADRNGGLLLWEAEAGLEYLTLGGHGSAINDLCWRGDGNVLASCGDDGAIRLWEVENGRQVKAWTAHGKGTSDIEFTRDGMIVSSGRDSLVKLWQQDGKMVRQFGGMKDIGIAVSFCDESQRIIGSDFSGQVAVWNAADGKLLSTIDTNPASLEDWILITQNALDDAKESLAHAAKEFGQVESALNKVVTELKTELESLVVCNLQIKKVESRIETASQQIDIKSKEYAVLETELGEKETQVPVLVTAMDSAAKAAALIPSDEALKQSADTIKIKHGECVARVGVLKEVIEKTANAIKAGQQGVEQLQTEIDSLQNVLGPINKRIEELKAQEKPLIENREALRPKLESARKQVADCEANLGRWKNELAFDKLMFEQAKLLSDANKRVVNRETVLADAKAKLEQAQLEYDSQAKQRDDAEAAATAIEMKIRKLRSRK